MHQIASKRNGKFLSPTYINKKTKHKWKCEKGHIWEAMPDSVKRGTWCIICAGKQKFTIEEMRSIAKSKGGKCLSNKYVNGRTNLKWQCSKGHTWFAQPTNVKQGSLCRDCSSAGKLTIEEMHQIAKKRKGKCLSKKYVNAATPLKWQCEKGHVWKARPNTVKGGSWCIDCSSVGRLTIEEMQSLAKDRGGKCLSSKYVNAGTNLKWQCKRGHVWEAPPREIKRNHWCPRCNTHLNEEICRVAFEQIFNDTFLKVRPSWLVNSRGNRMELDGYSKSLKIAFEYNGEQHYKDIKFFSGNKNNFLIDRKSDDSEKIKICKKRNIALFVISYKNDLSKISKIIKAQSKLLGVNTDNLNFNKKINYNSIYLKETHLDDLKKIAKSKNGKVLSKTYLGSQVKLKFQCNKGHVWETTPAVIKSGNWCPDCVSTKLTIEEMQSIAISKGGRCLSSKYTNSKTRLKWECKKGHIWQTTIGSIRKGSWCPTCVGVKKLNIEDMQKIARAKKGKCLSKNYVNAHTKLKWECKNGHTWEQKPYIIRAGSWCPKCWRNRDYA